jgi:predicted Rossmann fold flavoprotein
MASNDQVLKEKKVWDVAVLGGGAAGMMAAGAAAARGARVILIEKNPTLGKKLLITGGGRCNVTNAELDMRVFLAKFNGNASGGPTSKKRTDDKYLFSAFARHSVQDSLDFFHDHGMQTKLEGNGRVFPITDNAESVWEVLVNYMKEGGVTVLTGQTIRSIQHASDSASITSVTLGNDQVVQARTFILATGGISRPETGSTGDGFAWLRELGHSVSDTDAALVPIALSDAWPKKLSGLSLEDIQLTIIQDGTRQARTSGKMLFTHLGITGPAVLNLSRDVGELLKYGKVELALDLFPKMNPEMLDAHFHEVIAAHSNKQIRNVLPELSESFPSGLALPLLTIARVDPELPAHSLTRERRLLLVQLLKAIPLRVSGLLGTDKAIVTSGGVALSEIDFKSMRSHTFSNLFIVGDLLNLHRPSGGYSLQLCWTTGTLAGISAAEQAKTAKEPVSTTS